MNNPCFQPPTELARLLADKRLSAVALLEARLKHIHTLNPRLNAIVMPCQAPTIDYGMPGL